MTHPIDERLKFYIRHHRDIRKWSQIESEWNQKMHNWLLNQSEPIEESKPENARYYHYPHKAYPKHLLYKASWHPNKDPMALRGTEPPFVAIGIEWSSKNINLLPDLPDEYDTKHRLFLPYYGIWINRDSFAEADRFQSRLQLTLEEKIKAGEGVEASFYKEKPTSWWPLRKYFKPLDPDAITESIGEFERTLPRFLGNAWSELSGLVDESLFLMRQE